ncbi:TIR domain-containing protein [Candidatus Gracilibacteria bacterium]|nr:TIR domain-containing protein [Candidatus Gracilibacteria bacterium]
MNLFDSIIPKTVTLKPRRKIFISYHHANDQIYKNILEKILGDSVIHKSVMIGDINTDVSTDYIARLIREDYLSDASICIVLVGKDTYKRKHIDWEISGALDKKVGGYSGLLAIYLPTHPSYNTGQYPPDGIPRRLHKNIESGYAKMINWTIDKEVLLNEIELAFTGRKNSHLIVNRTIPQMILNRN